MKRIFSKEEAINFLNCNPNAMPCRIIEGLEKCGFKNIEKVGRGQKTTFICEQPDDTDEQCYYIFRDILINKYDYGKGFDYDKILEIIDFHIKNEEYISIEDIANKLNISDGGLYKHRKKLEGKILKRKEECKRNFTGIYKQISEKKIKNGFYVYRMLNKDNEVIYVGQSINLTNRMLFHFSNLDEDDWRNEVENVEYIELKTKTDMIIYEIYYIAKYYPKYNIDYKNDKCTFQLEELEWKNLCTMKKEPRNHDAYSVLRLYTITEELKHDEEFLEIIKKAIRFKNK